MIDNKKEIIEKIEDIEFTQEFIIKNSKKRKSLKKLFLSLVSIVVTASMVIGITLAIHIAKTGNI